MHVNALRLAASSIAILLFAFAVGLFLVGKSLTGLWFLPMVVVLFLVSWAPWYSSSKKKAD